MNLEASNQPDLSYSERHMTYRRHARLRRDRTFPAETTLPDAGEGLVVAVAGGSLGSAGIGDDGEGVAAAAALNVFSVAHVA